MSFQIAQDPALLLAVMAISLYLIRKNELLIAGLVLSLVLAKFHLFLPLFPAVLLARRWKFAAGFYGGSAFLVGISFLVDGQTPKPHELNTKVPETLSNLVMDCVRVNPAKRPADMHDLVRRLEVILYVLQRHGETSEPSAGHAAPPVRLARV